jgi:uncharacterized membrane protein YbhN (UPF0104 family)
MSSNIIINNSMKNVNEKRLGLVARVFGAFIRHARNSHSSSRHSSTLRTDFSIAIWSIVCVFIYFLIVFIYIYINNIKSGSNSSLFFVLVGALIVAILGAFFSPQLASALNNMTPQGRRQKFSSNQRRAVKKNIRR